MNGGPPSDSGAHRLSQCFDKEQGDRWVSITVGDNPDATSPLPYLARMVVHHPDYGVVDVREHEDKSMVQCYAEVTEWLTELSGGVSPVTQTEVINENPGQRHVYIPAKMLAGLRDFMFLMGNHLIENEGMTQKSFQKMCRSLSKQNSAFKDMLELMNKFCIK